MALFVPFLFGPREQLLLAGRLGYTLGGACAAGLLYGAMVDRPRLLGIGRMAASYGAVAIVTAHVVWYMDPGVVQSRFLEQPAR